MNQFLNQKRVTWAAAFGVALGLIVTSFYLPGGDDLYRYYLPFVQGCLDCGYTPYFVQWFLFPIKYFPGYPLTWPVLTIFTVSGFLLLASQLKINPLFLLLSFPMLGQIWLGQVDILIAFGLATFLFGGNPYIRGVGLTLALSKPQLTALPIFLCFLLDSPRIWVKLLLAPVLTLIASLFYYGPHWPLFWFHNATTELPIHVWRLAGMDFWRIGLFLIPLPFLFRDKKERLLAGLLVSSLATPFFGVYSYIVFLLFHSKWWLVLLSYTWLLGFAFWQENSMRFAWVLPVGMLIDLCYSNWKNGKIFPPKPSLDASSSI